MKLIGFILSIVAVVVGFVVALLDHEEDATKKRNRRVIIALATLSGMVALGILVVSFVDSRADARISASQKTTMREISKAVNDALDKLGKQSEVLSEIVKNVRTPVAMVSAEITSESLESNPKEGIGSLPRIARRDTSTLGYLQLRPGERYSRAMILAYLWATPHNLEQIQTELAKRTFPTHEFLEHHGVPRPKLKYVVLIDTDGTPLGFWHADLFAYQLLDQELIRRHEDVTVDKAQPAATFIGYVRAINEANTAAELSAMMIEQHTDEAVIRAPNGTIRHADLADILKPVEETRTASASTTSPP